MVSRANFTNQRDYLEWLELTAIKSARASLFSFIKYVFPIAVTWNWHHEVVCGFLDAFIRRETSPRLMLFMPPQHQKTTMSTEHSSAYALGLNPDDSVIVTMFDTPKAEELNRKIQRIIISEPYKKLFPETKLNEKNVVSTSQGAYVRNSNKFETVGRHGFLKSAGVGAGIAGTPAKLVFLDDVIKNAEEAFSKTYRDKTYRWYTDEVEARLHNDSRVCFTITRRHPDDLAGRLLERDGRIEEGGLWQVITLPAIKEQHGAPYDPREIGEALFPELHSRERMERIRDTEPRTFASLYQQNPVIEGGNMVKKEWFGSYKFEDLVGLPLKIHTYTDTATSEKELKNNDPTGILHFTFYKNRLYLLHWDKGRMGFPALVRAMIAANDMAIPVIEKTVNGMNYIENKSNGPSLKQQLVEDTQLSVTLENPGKLSKAERLELQTERIKTGRVLLPEGAGWPKAFIETVCGFPALKHDEEVDCLTGSMRVSFKSVLNARPI